MSNDFDAITLDTAATALGFLPAYDRDVWVRMAMAMKSEFGEAGFDVWDHWSSTADNYNSRAALATWRSVKPGGAVGIGSLLHEAKQSGFTFEKPELSLAEKAEQQKVIEQRKRAREQAEKDYAAWQSQWYGRVAKASQLLFDEYLNPTGSSKYLGTKQCKAHGIGFVHAGFVVLVDEPDENIKIISGADSINAFFAALDYEQLKASGKWFIHAKRGTIAVPLRHAAGTIQNIQFIFATGKKQFIKNGRKSGLFHIIGDIDKASVLLVAEGYATASTLHEATGHPVAVAFDADNMTKVAPVLHNLLPKLPMVICGDDDVATKGNPGRTMAEQAASDVGGVAVFPVFKGAA